MSNKWATGINLNVNFLNILFILCLLWDESLILVFSSTLTVNGVCDELQSLGVEGRPVSLFQCQVLLVDNSNSAFQLVCNVHWLLHVPLQVSLFKGWVNAWSDDLKSYLLLRLKANSFCNASDL